MTAPAKEKWWDDVVSVDTCKLDNGTHLLWGDRVKVLEQDDGPGGAARVKIRGRGTTGWVRRDVLGGKELLELYFIDVGQGDGILIVTPEGHHLLMDGGHQRSKQQTGKSAADFVDWKFHREYLLRSERCEKEKNVIRLDAMIASHADEDHYGGLRDLIDRTRMDYEEELDSFDTTVEAFYHPGLCPQHHGTEGLGSKVNGHFVDLLKDRADLKHGLSDKPGDGAVVPRGRWRSFLEAIEAQLRKDGKKTPVVRLSQESRFLPGFEPGKTSVTICVLAPIETSVSGQPALKDLGNTGENKNGHSVALRLDFGDRRLLLTGDLNAQSQASIIEHYGDRFESVWRSDVAKACHHGSHHVDFRFLRGVAALSTVFSSGDANRYDHPRAWVLGAAAISGRVIEDTDRHRLLAPLIYSTEVARSVRLGSVDQLRQYDTPQSYGRPSEVATHAVSGKVTKSNWRLVFDRKSARGSDFPPLPTVKAVRGVVYGLVNARTDGRKLLLAVRNEGDRSWAYETLKAKEIERAVRYLPERED